MTKIKQACIDYLYNYRDKMCSNGRWWLHYLDPEMEFEWVIKRIPKNHLYWVVEDVITPACIDYTEQNNWFNIVMHRHIRWTDFPIAKAAIAKCEELRNSYNKEVYGPASDAWTNKHMSDAYYFGFVVPSRNEYHKKIFEERDRECFPVIIDIINRWHESF